MAMNGRLIDTHLHIWNLERAQYEWLKNDSSILNRSYHLAELEGERMKAGVSEAILVQAANNLEDTDWLLETARQTPWISGVVGWLALTEPKQTDKLLKEKFIYGPYFRGVRHLIHDEKDPRWLLQDKVIDSLNMLAACELPYDVVGVLPEHIETALEVASKVPGLRLVFDHL